MKARRRNLGRHIKISRRRAGFRSQKAFALAIGVNESSVAHAETGSDRIGDAVFTAIEVGLRWPTDSIKNYLAEKTGELPTAPPATPAPQIGPDLRDDIERQLWAITDLTEDERRFYIDLYRAKRSRELGQSGD